MGITQASSTPEGHGEPLTWIGEITQQDASGEMANLGPAGNFHHQITT